jgi:RNA polymerase sigma-70 factor, ECF subfamily
MGDLEALFTAHHHRLFRYFCRAVGHPETARDLTQDVFVRVSRTAIPSADEGGVRSWLFRIARNLALDHHRSQARHPEPATLVNDGARAAPQDVGLAVNEALASLPDLDRDVFLMREVAGLGYEDIAGACGLTADAVRSRIHRTRLQLRVMLAAPIAARQTSPMRRSGNQIE